MSSINVQRLKTVDEALIAQLNALFDDPWDALQGDKFLANPDNALFVAFIDGYAAGFLTAHRLQRLDSKQAEVLLYEIATHENFRQRGVASALINEVKTWAKQVGADNVWVLTYASNLPAMHLYKSTGGEQDEPGTRMFTYKIN